MGKDHSHPPCQRSGTGTLHVSPQNPSYTKSPTLPPPFRSISSGRPNQSLTTIRHEAEKSVLFPPNSPTVPNTMLVLPPFLVKRRITEVHRPSAVLARPMRATRKRTYLLPLNPSKVDCMTRAATTPQVPFGSRNFAIIDTESPSSLLSSNAAL